MKNSTPDEDNNSDGPREILILLLPHPEHSEILFNKHFHQDEKNKIFSEKQLSQPQGVVENPIINMNIAEGLLPNRSEKQHEMTAGFIVSSLDRMDHCVMAINSDLQMRYLAHGIKYLTFCRLHHLSRKLSIEHQSFTDLQNRFVENFTLQFVNLYTFIADYPKMSEAVKKQLEEVGSAVAQGREQSEEQTEAVKMIFHLLLFWSLEYLQQLSAQDKNELQTKSFEQVVVRGFLINQVLPLLGDQPSSIFRSLEHSAADTSYWLDEMQSFYGLQ